MNDVFIIIPTLMPEEKVFIPFINKLKKNFGHIIVVDDGSGSKYENIFKIIQKDNVKVLKHYLNMGKGRAIKTAINYILNNYKNIAWIVTADSDGQHSIKDIKSCVKESISKEDSYILGVRNFKSKNVPWKSRYGNNITRSVMKLLIGLNISDTQTGLRAMSKSVAEKLLTVSGERYEYETNTLIFCKEQDIKISEISIETIYLNNNIGSHFNPLKDGLKIYKLFFKYIISSGSSFLLDIILFSLFCLIFKSNPDKAFIATIFARILSSIYNFMINSKLVFKKMDSNSLAKYFILVFFQMFVSATIVNLLSHVSYLNIVIIKIIIDLIIFIINFIIQREWIFKTKAICLIILLLLTTTGCKERVHKKIPKDVNITFKDLKIDVFKDISLQDLIENTNVEIINENIDTTNIGNFSKEYYFKYNNKKYVSNLEYEVKDDVAPKIFGSASKTILINYKNDLCSLIMYGDNYDSEPFCEVEGDYDLAVPGNYEIKYIVKDQSNNEKTYNMKLNVVESIESKPNIKTESLSFNEAYKKYKNDQNELGIDVSKWQGDIDFDKVKQAGATFVIIRLGVKQKSFTEPLLDSYYLQNIKKAKEAGLKVGVYLYSKALSKQEAIGEANWLLTNLNHEQLDLPVVFDWEIFSGWNSYKLSFHELNEIADGFLKTIEAAGYKSMLYGSKFYLENFWDDEKYDIWLAHYTEKTTYQNYHIWQFSNKGLIDGIKGDVDLDILINEA